MFMELQFANITADIYEDLQEELTKIGVSISGDSGNITTKGIEGRFQRNPESDTLAIQIDKTPIILPENIVANKIIKVVERLGGTVV